MAYSVKLTVSQNLFCILAMVGSLSMPVKVVAAQNKNDIQTKKLSSSSKESVPPDISYVSCDDKGSHCIATGLKQVPKNNDPSNPNVCTNSLDCDVPIAYVSEDGQKTWTKTNMPEVRSLQIELFSMHCNDNAQYCYLVGGFGFTKDHEERTGFIFSTRDGGYNWSVSSNEFAWGACWGLNQFVRSVDVDVAGQKAVAVGTCHTYSTEDNRKIGFAVYSSDGGNTWHNSTLTPREMGYVDTVVCNKEKNQCIASGGTPKWITLDYGKTWSAIH